MSSPAYGAAVIVDRVITDEVDESPEWDTPEKDALRRALDEWLHETGPAGFPDSLMELRYAMFGELQDELPAGLYDFILDMNAGEREKVLQRDRPPVPGQATTIDGQTFIIDSVAPARGSEFVAVVRAHLHPG